MTDFTRDWIAKREQLEATATPGPWSAADEYGDISGSDYLWCVSQMRPGFEAMSPTEGYVGDVAEVGDSEADAEFIADARTALPAALAALRAVLELHRLNREDDGNCQGYTSSGYGYLDRWCFECSEQSGREYGVQWPCLTVRAVEAALRGES